VARQPSHYEDFPADRLVPSTDLAVHWIMAVVVGVLAILAAAAVIFLVFAALEVVRAPQIRTLENTFNAILLVFIMVEMYSLGAHFLRGQNVVDKVFELGLVALVRQLIVAEFLHISVSQLLAIAALVIALSGGWYLVHVGPLKRSHSEYDDPERRDEPVGYDEV